MTTKPPYERLLDTIETYRKDDYEIDKIRVPQQFFDALVSDANFVRPECDDTDAPEDPNTAQVAGYEVVADDVYSIIVDVDSPAVTFADDATLTVQLNDGDTLEYPITDASFESDENVYEEHPGIATNIDDTTTITDYTGEFTVDVEELSTEAYLELFGIDDELVDEFDSELTTPHTDAFEHTERFESTNDMHDAKYVTDPERIDEQLTEHPIPLGEAAVVYVNSLELQELIAHDDFERVTEDDDIELHHPDAVGLFNGAEVVHDQTQQRAMVDTISTL